MPKNQPTLQSALQQLEEILDSLKHDGTDIDVGLKKFKEGVELIKFCRGYLKKAENEFSELKKELEIE